MKPLDKITEAACQHFRDAVTSEAERIKEEWARAIDIAESNGKTPKFKLGFSVTVHGGGEKITTALTFGSRTKFEQVGEVDDGQEKLPFECSIT